MLSSRCSRLASTLALTSLVAWSSGAKAEPARPEVPLYLEVFINGQPTGLIANFVLRPEQRLAITVTELRELRISPDPTNGLVSVHFRHHDVHQYQTDVGRGFD